MITFILLEWVFQAPEKHCPQCIWLLIDGNCIYGLLFFLWDYDPQCSKTSKFVVWFWYRKICGKLLKSITLPIETATCWYSPARRSVGSLKTGDCMMIAEKNRQEDAEEPRAPSWS